MKIPDFSLLTDENIDAQIAAYLRSQNYDVKDVKEESLQGSDDVVLLRLSVSENRMVVTHDSDFGTLAIAGGEPYLGLIYLGLIYLRPGHVRTQFTIGTIQTLLAEDPEVVPPFIIVAARAGGNVKIRIRC